MEDMPTQINDEKPLYQKIVGIELDYEHFGNVKNAFEWCKQSPELADVIERKDFRLSVGSRGYHLRKDNGKVFQYYHDLYRPLVVAISRPSRFCVVLTQMGTDQWGDETLPPPLRSTLEKKAKAELAKKEAEQRRKEKKIIADQLRKEKKEKEKEIAALVKAKIKEQYPELNSPKPKKRKLVTLEVPRNLLDVNSD